MSPPSQFSTSHRSRQLLRDHSGTFGRLSSFPSSASFHCGADARTPDTEPPNKADFPPRRISGLAGAEIVPAVARQGFWRIRETTAWMVHGVIRTTPVALSFGRLFSTASLPVSLVECYTLIHGADPQVGRNTEDQGRRPDPGGDIQVTDLCSDNLPTKG